MTEQTFHHGDQVRYLGPTHGEGWDEGERGLQVAHGKVGHLVQGPETRSGKPDEPAMVCYEVMFDGTPFWVRAERLDLKALSGRILEASGLAAAEVRERLRERLLAGLPESLRAAIGSDGVVDVNRLLPADPTDLLRR